MRVELLCWQYSMGAMAMATHSRYFAARIQRGEDVCAIFGAKTGLTQSDLFGYSSIVSGNIKVSVILSVTVI